MEHWHQDRRILVAAAVYAQAVALLVSSVGLLTTPLRHRFAASRQEQMRLTLMVQLQQNEPAGTSVRTTCMIARETGTRSKKTEDSYCTSRVERC